MELSSELANFGARWEESKIAMADFWSAEISSL